MNKTTRDAERQKALFKKIYVSFFPDFIHATAALVDFLNIIEWGPLERGLRGQNFSNEIEVSIVIVTELYSNHPLFIILIFGLSSQY